MPAFADRLWRLKMEAGDPSFAEMCSRLGAAASKSTLAAAAQGRTLPSWGTTWEFVRVLAVGLLGRDPEETEREWRGHWLRARALAESGGEESSEEAAEDAVPAERVEAGPPAPRSPLGEETGPQAVQMPPKAGRSRLRAGGLIGAGALAALTGVAAFLLSGGDDAPSPPERTALQVDDSVFEGDITYPDGTLVAPGAWFEKVWRLRNTGTVEWSARYLMRVNDADCKAPERVEIPHTAPGKSVDIRVLVRASEEPGNCRIYWKMVDLQGRTLFPGKRPIFLDVRVG